MAGQIYRALSRGRESYNKIKNNIISKYLGDGLSDLNSTNPELDGVSGLKKDTSKDSGYDKNLGQPKQDLNKQPVPEYQAPTAGGFGALGDGVKQFTDGLKNQQTTQETTQPPVTDNGVGTYESNLKAKNDAIKKQNEDYMKKYIDFYNKASKFGELGQKFQTDATNLLQYNEKSLLREAFL